LTGLLDEYQKYADPRSQEGKIYTKTASNIIRSKAQRSGMGDDEMEDLMQMLAMDFLKPLVEGGKDMMDNLRQSFHIEGGPLSLNKLWMSMVDKRVTWRIRETLRLHKEKTFDLKHNEEGDELDPVAQIPGNAEPFDESKVAPMLRDLGVYVKPKLHNPKFVDMFNRWLEFAMDKGAVNDIDMKNDVYQEMVKDGLTTTYQSFADQWRANVYPTIVRFFVDEMDMDPAVVRRYVGSDIIEAVTQVEYRRQVAKWMIGGILRAQIEAGE